MTEESAKAGTALRAAPRGIVRRCPPGALLADMAVMLGARLVAVAVVALRFVQVLK
jgi:hypothetical protein